MDWHDVINSNLIQQERIHSISPSTRRVRRVPCWCLRQPDVARFENEFRWVFEFQVVDVRYVCGIDCAVNLHVIHVSGLELLRVFYYTGQLDFGIGEDELKPKTHVLPLSICREDFHMMIVLLIIVFDNKR